MKASTTLTEIVIGSLGGILVVICMIPQLYSIIRNKSCKDVSIVMYIILLIGELLWCTYGVLRNDLQIIITNACSSFISVLIILLGLIYKNSEDNFI